MPRNMTTITFNETDSVPNNFEHKIKPFERNKNSLTAFKPDTSDLLSIAQKYNNSKSMNKTGTIVLES